jgi:hypothetical protein
MQNEDIARLIVNAYNMGKADGHNEGYMTRNRGTYNDFRSYCDNQVPYEYRNNAGAARSWSNGCVNRLQQEQYTLEQEAYRNGSYPR